MSESKSSQFSHILDGLKAGKRSALSKAITLVESQLNSDKEIARELIKQVIPLSGQSLRIAITGTPGVGKSTFIQRLGLQFLDQTLKIAVLTIDPSSPRSGGSLLGDKTRMKELTSHDNIFIRPSPSSHGKGGLTRTTKESILLCEAAGYNVVIVETAGVGQTDFEVSNLVDIVVLLVQPGAGDDLQGMKKGILETADVILINKADGQLENAAKDAKSALETAFGLIQSDESPQILLISSLNNTGIKDAASIIKGFSSERIQSRRTEQNIVWMENLIRDRILEDFYDSEKVKVKLEEVRKLIRSGEITAVEAADMLIKTKGDA